MFFFHYRPKTRDYQRQSVHKEILLKMDDFSGGWGGIDGWRSAATGQTLLHNYQFSANDS